jgi:hydrogenase maturation protein HypF
LAARAEAVRTYPFSLRTERGEPAVLGFGPTLRAIVADLDRGVDKATVAAIFHRSVAAGIAETCGWIRSCRGLTQVVLSGGVFQNDLLLTRTWDALAAHGFLVFSHQRVPPNDAGLALGQAVVALTTCAQG